MNFNQYQKVINQLQNKWGNTNFDSRKIELIWEAVHSLTQDDFQQICDYFIGEDKRPTVSAFREQKQKILNKKRSYQTDSIFLCPFCDDSGWIVAEDYPLEKSTSKLPLKRCDCVGGYKNLSNIIKNSDNPDLKLCKRLEQYGNKLDFIPGREFKQNGYKLLLNSMGGKNEIDTISSNNTRHLNTEC